MQSMSQSVHGLVNVEGGGGVVRVGGEVIEGQAVQVCALQAVVATADGNVRAADVLHRSLNDLPLKILKPKDGCVFDGHSDHGADGLDPGNLRYESRRRPVLRPNPHLICDVSLQDKREEVVEDGLAGEHHDGVHLGFQDVLHHVPHDLICASRDRGDDPLVGDADAVLWGLFRQALHALQAVVVVAAQEGDPLPVELNQELDHGRHLVLVTGNGAEERWIEELVAQHFI